MNASTAFLRTVEPLLCKAVKSLSGAENSYPETTWPDEEAFSIWANFRAFSRSTDKAVLTFNRSRRPPSTSSTETPPVISKCASGTFSLISATRASPDLGNENSLTWVGLSNKNFRTASYVARG